MVNGMTACVYQTWSRHCSGGDHVSTVSLHVPGLQGQRRCRSFFLFLTEEKRFFRSLEFLYYCARLGLISKSLLMTNVDAGCMAGHRHWGGGGECFSPIHPFECMTDSNRQTRQTRQAWSGYGGRARRHSGRCGHCTFAGRWGRRMGSRGNSSSQLRIISAPRLQPRIHD